MKRGSIVKLTKISSIRSGKLPDGYWTKGALIDDIILGSPVVVARTSRVGLAGEQTVIERPGLYRSSPVVKIDGNQFTTNNSVWKVE